MGSVTALLARWRRVRRPVTPPSPPEVEVPQDPIAEHRQRAWTVGDLARINGSKAPFEDGERVNGYLTIRPGTIYLGKVEWWRHTEDPRVLHCTVCDGPVTNYYLAVNRHVQERHRPDQT